MNIIFLWPFPAPVRARRRRLSAKGCEIPTISTGAMLREAIKKETASGLSAKSYVDSGALVPNEVVIGILKDRLAEEDCKNGFILDGFPRTIPQAEALEKMDIRIDVVLSLEVSDETIVERLSGRRLCASCGNPYHVKYNPPKDGSRCDKCGGESIVRRDDDPAVVKSRLDTYHEETEPLKAYYESKGILKKIIGQEEVADTTKLTLAALGIE